MSSVQDFDFANDGLQIMRDLWPDGALDAFENVIEEKADTILKHLGIYIADLSIYDKLRSIEKNDKNRFYQLCTLSGSTIAGARLVASSGISSFMQNALGWGVDSFFSIPAMFWNDLAVTRLQYAWHQEASYYNATWRNVVNLWAPLFRDLSIDDGPMVVLPGSHKDGLRGFNKSQRAQGLMQLEIADDELQSYEKYFCAIKRGQAVLFDQLLVHCTGPNLVPQPRASLIIRFFSTTGEAALDAPIRPWNPPR